MTVKPWKILKSTYLIKDRWRTVRADRCETENGVLVDPFYVLEKQDWVHVVAFDSEDRVLIIRQYRHGVEQICAEIPCGVLEDSDRSPLEGIKRELLEETG